MEQQKILFEMTESEYEDLKKLLSDLADVEQEHRRMKALIRQALANDSGTVRIASQSAANTLLRLVKCSEAADGQTVH